MAGQDNGPTQQGTVFAVKVVVASNSSVALRLMRRWHRRDVELNKVELAVCTGQALAR